GACIAYFSICARHFGGDVDAGQVARSSHGLHVGGRGLNAAFDAAEEIEIVTDPYPRVVCLFPWGLHLLKRSFRRLLDIAEFEIGGPLPITAPCLRENSSAFFK